MQEEEDKSIELRCNRLIIENIKGEPRIVLDAVSEGAASFVILGKRAEAVSIVVDDRGVGTINVFREDGTIAVAFGIGDDASAGISIHDEEGKLAGLLRYNSNEKGKLTLFKDGRPIAEY